MERNNCLPVIVIGILYICGGLFLFPYILHAEAGKPIQHTEHIAQIEQSEGELEGQSGPFEQGEFRNQSKLARSEEHPEQSKQSESRSEEHPEQSKQSAAQSEKQPDQPDEDEQAIIIEVEGDVAEHTDFIEKNYPFIDVVATYETIFNGIALKASTKKLKKIGDEDFIQSIHPSRTYEIPSPEPQNENDEEGEMNENDEEADTDNKDEESGTDENDEERDMNENNPFSIVNGLPLEIEDDPLKDETIEQNAVIPSNLNDTSYTGKDVKVGVIDTGIDYNHPDLQTNYHGGYDVVDLDDDPMETEGTPMEETVHGTHVAGTIAADGNIEGVAPDAEIYAYRALGPGGKGSTVNILAALEKAVEDDVDLINLSLGNAVNGPDYPTSLAVNRAVEHGVTVVIASGNDGPYEWTVGSPATASDAITVGAIAPPTEIAMLHEGKHDKSISLQAFMGSVPWDIEKDHEVVDMDNNDDENGSLHDKIALFERGETPFYDMAKEAEEKGAKAVLIYNNEEDENEPLEGTIEHEDDPIRIPVASISKKDGEWLAEHATEDTLYVDTTYQKSDTAIADFSSRGPVTLNWAIKPDITAPGVNVLSTIPEGYQMLQGTSMATPHVTGVLALLKEAHPDWSPEQLKGAITTTSQPLQEKEDAFYEPIEQGTGTIEPQRAVQTPAIMDKPSLAFGKITQHATEQTADMTLTNTSDQTQEYRFDMPKSEKGLIWNLPQTFTIEPEEEKTIEIDMRANPEVLNEGVHQGYLTLNETDNTYHIPYLFLNKTADYPKAMGFELTLNELSDETYEYQLYLAEAADRVTVDLYNPDTLLYERSLLELDEPQTGLNEGEMEKREIGESGYYKAIITVESEDGSFESYETEVVF